MARKRNRRVRVQQFYTFVAGDKIFYFRRGEIWQVKGKYPGAPDEKRISEEINRNLKFHDITREI